MTEVRIIRILLRSIYRKRRKREVKNKKNRAFSKKNVLTSLTE